MKLIESTNVPEIEKKGLNQMNLDDIRRMDAEFITPKVAAGILRCDPHLIRVQAREDPESLGFPVIRVGSRIKIPRLAFIRCLEGTTTPCA